MPPYLGPGFSGYAILNSIPIPLLPSSSPENENIIKSNVAYHSDPAIAVGPLPVKNRRALNPSFSTFICPKTMPLVKALSYGRRTLALMDFTPEIPFIYIGANQEGYQGTGYVDSIDITCSEGEFVKLTVSMTSWVWTDLFGTQDLSKLGNQILPFSDLYKPVPFWQTIPKITAISSNSIPLNWSLKINNNWNYQAFLSGFQAPPNPSLITQGDLDITLSLSWLANRNDRPLETGSVQIQIGVPALDTIIMDRVVRDPQRSLEGVGSGSEVVKWAGSFYAQGSVPRSI